MPDAFLTPEAFAKADESTQKSYQSTPDEKLGVHLLDVPKATLTLDGGQVVELALEDLTGMKNTLAEVRSERQRYLERLQKIPEGTKIDDLLEAQRKYTELSEQINEQGETIPKAAHEQVLEGIRGEHTTALEAKEGDIQAARDFAKRFVVKDPVRALFEGEKPAYQGSPDRLLDYLEARGLVDVVWENGTPEVRIFKQDRSGYEYSRRTDSGGSTFMGIQEWVEGFAKSLPADADGIFHRKGLTGPNVGDPESKNGDDGPNPFEYDTPAFDIGKQVAYLREHGRDAYNKMRAEAKAKRAQAKASAR